jgi:macrolide transport system ATP-binding/permease protein
MKQLRAWIFRLAGILPGERRERELADELESHLQMHIDDNLRSGMSPEQARRVAMLKLGGTAATAQAYRERRGVPLVENLLLDVRFALRQLRKNPGFTATAILMLALGLCASVSIFAFVDAALIKPLPYRNPERLVGLFAKAPACTPCNLSYLDYLDWKRLNRVFSSLEAYNHPLFMLSTPLGTGAANGTRVSDGFFRTLGVAPVLGRDFYAGEDLPAAPRTVILSYAVWQKRYNGRPDVIGQTVTLNGELHTVIGVLPREFHFAPAEPSDFWTTLHPAPGCDLRRGCHGMFGIARLKDGVSVSTALADVVSIAQQLEKQYPDSNHGFSAIAMPLTEAVVGNLRAVLLVLLSGAGLLLLIATVNIASLLLVRSESRRREMAVRSSLGASRARLVRQFVAEALVLVVSGGAIGLTSAGWAMQLLKKLIPPNRLAGMPFLHGLGFDLRVVLFAAAISLLAALLFSLTPALRLRLPEMRAGLAEGSRGSAGTTWGNLGSKLVIVELATAVALLAGAGLLGQSLYRLLHVEIGLRPDRLASVYVMAPASRYSLVRQCVALERRIISDIANLPGVKSVGITSALPVRSNDQGTWIRVMGKPWLGDHNDVLDRDVSSDYLATIGAKLLRGRYFTDAEDGSKPRVVIVNQAMAKRYFPGEDPVGKQISFSTDPPVPMEIVGLVEDIKEGPLDIATYPAMYVPFNQNADNGFAVVVRTSAGGESLLSTLAGAIHGIDPGVVTEDERMMTARIGDSQSAYLHRSTAWLVGGFAALALLLSVVGLYGVVAYSVGQRTREIGVRMALGAEPGAVYRLILKEAGWLTAGGIVLGLAGSLAVGALMRGLLFGVDSWDMPTLAAVAGVLGVAALLASYIPARRAASVNPVEALRAE